MSRIDNIHSNYPEEHDNLISSVLDRFDIKEEKVVFLDFDSALYHILWEGYKEDGTKNEPYSENDLELLKGKLSEYLLKILNNIETYFIIKGLYIFIRGRDNYRKKLLPEYKANRAQKNPLTIPLYQYLVDNHNAIPADGYEAEDLCFSGCMALNHDCIIGYVDHDLLEIPNAILYNYQKDIWLRQTEEQAKFELVKKLCLSEPGDNVKTSPGIGKVYFNKNFTIGMSDYRYKKELLKAYLKAWKGDSKKAKEQLWLSWKILKLQNVTTNEKEEANK